MKIKVYIDRKAAIAAGYDGSSTAEVEIDLAALTRDQREALACMANNVLLTVAVPTIEAVAAGLDERIEAAEKYRIAKEKNDKDARAALTSILAVEPEEAVARGWTSTEWIEAARNAADVVTYKVTYKRGGEGAIEVQTPAVRGCWEAPRDLVDAIAAHKRRYEEFRVAALKAAEPLALAELEAGEAAERSALAAERSALEKRAIAISAQPPFPRVALSEVEDDRREQVVHWMSHDVLKSIGELFGETGQGSVDDPVRAAFEIWNADNGEVALSGKYLATIIPDAKAPGGFERQWWRSGPGSRAAVVPSTLAPADFVERGKAADRYIVLERVDSRIYLLPLRVTLSPALARNAAKTISEIVESWRGAAAEIDTVALESEREALRARITEIDALLADTRAAVGA